MEIIPNVLTIVEVCQRLGVTPSWVNKAIRDLDLPREGRGKLRQYGWEEYRVLGNAKMLLQMGFSLTYLKNLQKEESEAREKIVKFLKEFKKAIQDGSIKVRGSQATLNFILSFSLTTEFNEYCNNNGKEEMWVDSWEIIIEQSKAKIPENLKADIKDRIEKVSSEMQDFKKSLQLIYKSIEE